MYLAPFGFPAVTSSGTVSGCAPTVIGCGTMIATRGIFTATGPPATITACGEGTGSATLVGEGTVWPAGFMGMVSFVSSGTVTGSGRVKGCGTITGVGTFTVSEPYTTTSTLAGNGGQATVNVYVSYCPPEIDGAGGAGTMNPLLRLAGNASVFDQDATGLSNPDSDPELEPGSHSSDSEAPRYALSGLSATHANLTGPFALLNTTSTNSTNGTAGPLCAICPQDSGICCPPTSRCGGDGHCPWHALEACGYARFGVNIVDVRNSSRALGEDTDADGGDGRMSRRSEGAIAHVHVHARAHGHGY